MPVLDRAPLVAAPAPPPEPVAPTPPRRSASAAEGRPHAGARAAEVEHLGSRSASPVTPRPESGDANERAALLLHLRQFADADGTLPVEFDGLVRESFGRLLAGVGPA